MMVRRDHAQQTWIERCTEGAGISDAISMSTHSDIDWTVIDACAAADATQDILRLRSQQA